MALEGTVEGGKPISPRSLPVLLRVLNPVRVSVLWAGLAVVVVSFALYERLFLLIPSKVSKRFRERHYVGRWNRVIASWGGTLYGLARVATGARAAVEGIVPPGRYLVVANHQSTADIVLLFHVLRDKNLKFVAKKELFRFVPNVAPALRRGGFGMVDFSDRRRTLDGLLDFARSMTRWEGSPVLYPEGVRTFDGSISRFQSAGLRLLVKETGLPVLPIVVDDLWQVRTVKEFFLYLPGSRGRVRILPPVPNAEAMADLEGFPRRLEGRMREELARMRREPARPVVL